jgi:hypothetical protein
MSSSPTSADFGLDLYPRQLPHYLHETLWFIYQDWVSQEALFFQVLNAQTIHSSQATNRKYGRNSCHQRTRSDSIKLSTGITINDEN